MEKLWNSQAFSDLKTEWYEKLQGSGFEDIECGENLIVWHSTAFQKPSAILRSEKQAQYQARIDSFANDPQFVDIVFKMSRELNVLFTSEGIEYIWTLHREGRSERNIAEEMECSKSCIHYMLKRLREWMNLIA